MKKQKRNKRKGRIFGEVLKLNCVAIKKRLLRRWKGTALEVKTLCWGPMQRDDEVGGEEMDSWLDDVARGRFVPAPPFSTVETIFTSNETAVMRTNKFSGTFSTL